MPGTPQYIWMEGELRPASEGVVPFVNAGLHYGFSVFEGIRCYATQQIGRAHACWIPRWWWDSAIFPTRETRSSKPFIR